MEYASGQEVDKKANNVGATLNRCVRHWFASRKCTVHGSGGRNQGVINKNITIKIELYSNWLRKESQSESWPDASHESRRKMRFAGGPQSLAEADGLIGRRINKLNLQPPGGHLHHYHVYHSVLWSLHEIRLSHHFLLNNQVSGLLFFTHFPSSS